jgi:hypothetical protein
MKRGWEEALKELRPDPEKDGIRPHFARLRREFTIDVFGWWSSLRDRSEPSIMFLYPPAQRDRRFPGISVFSNSREGFWLSPQPLFYASSEPEGQSGRETIFSLFRLFSVSRSIGFGYC